MKITILGNPATKKNSQRMVRLKNGRTIPLPSKAFEDYQKAAGAYIPANARVSLSERVNVKATYYICLPAAKWTW